MDCGAYLSGGYGFYLQKVVTVSITQHNPMAKQANSPGWYECDDCGTLHVSKEKADECCKGRHSKENKTVYGSKPNAWV